MDSSILNLAIVVAAGAIGSATLLPMKFIKGWKWENMWLVYAVLAYLLFPWLAAWYFVPGLLDVYSEASTATLLLVVVFGFGWGLSVVMLGLAVAAVGLAVSTGIILGCSIALGSLIPFLLLGQENFITPTAARILIANLTILMGVVTCARAGHLRDHGADENAIGRSSGTRGLILCFVAGILTPLLNVALSSGAPITELAVRHGAAPHQAANSVWALAVGAGSIPSIIYCTLLLGRNKSSQEYSSSNSFRNFVLCLLMAIFFIVSTIGYGIGAVRMGDLGPVLGWPVYISSIIVGNSFWGWSTGEWNGASRKAKAMMAAGLALQVAGIVLLFTINPINAGT